MGIVVVVPGRSRKGLMRVCVGVVGLAAEKAGRVIKAESEPQKRSDFPLLDLYDFICRVYPRDGLTADRRVAGARSQALKLQFDEFALSQSKKVRIYHYYVPVFPWCKRELEAHTSTFKLGKPVSAALVIGITSAPQGCSKTIIVYRYSLEYLFNSL